MVQVRAAAAAVVAERGGLSLHTGGRTVTLSVRGTEAQEEEEVYTQSA